MLSDWTEGPKWRKIWLRGWLEGQQVSRFSHALLRRFLRAWERRNNYWDQYLHRAFHGHSSILFVLEILQYHFPAALATSLLQFDDLQIRMLQEISRLQWRACLCCNPSMVSWLSSNPGDHDGYVISSQFPGNVKCLLEIFKTTGQLSWNIRMGFCFHHKWNQFENRPQKLI